MKVSGSRRIIGLQCAVACIFAFQVGIFGAAYSRAQEIRTPAAPATPRVNGPTIFGVRPGSPVVYKIPATGDGTITYSVDNLPAGLSVNSSTGMISGTLNATGEYDLTLRATNSLGTNTKNFRIEVGDTISLTPPMGWNSWNCWGSSVDGTKWVAAAQGMVDSGLINHGWSYINVDDGWQAPRAGEPNTALQGNSKFADMGNLIAQIHALNLKAGLYSTPWVQSYAGYPGDSAMYADGSWTKNTGTKQVNQHILPWDVGPYTFETNDATQWAAWGVDYLKYDWNPIQLPETVRMENALKASGRDVVYSLSNSIPFANIATLAPHANAWRTTGDIRDNWASMSSKGFGQDQWAPYQIPGHWNDPDMMVVGNVGWGSTQHPSGLTPDEQYTHVTLWCMLSAPLLLGNNLQQMDAFTLNLLTNDEVLAVNQDALGQQATTKAGAGTNLRVYVKDLEDGSKAIGLFNLGNAPATVTANWSDLGVSGSKMIRDLWRQIDRGEYNNQFSMVVAPHGAEMLRVFPATTAMGVLWTGGNGSDATNWGLAANWAPSIVPDGAGSKVSLGGQASANNVIDMVAIGRTVGNIDFSSATNTTVQSSGGYSLTLDNSGDTSMINVAGTHTITAALVLNNDVTLNGSGTLTLSGRVSGAHGLYLSSGNLTLAAANDYTGSTLVYDGTLRLNGDNLLPYGTGKGNVNLSSYSAVLELNNYNANVNGLYGTAGSVRNSGASAKTLTLGNANANGDYWGTIDGNLALTKTGTGVQTISGANTYTGLTTIAAGTLETGNDSRRDHDPKRRNAGRKRNVPGRGTNYGARHRC
jgi:alpha-galactosidase